MYIKASYIFSKNRVERETEELRGKEASDLPGLARARARFTRDALKSRTLHDVLLRNKVDVANLKYVIFDQIETKPLLSSDEGQRLNNRSVRDLKQTRGCFLNIPKPLALLFAENLLTDSGFRRLKSEQQNVTLIKRKELHFDPKLHRLLIRNLSYQKQLLGS